MFLKSPNKYLGWYQPLNVYYIWGIKFTHVPPDAPKRCCGSIFTTIQMERARLLQSAFIAAYLLHVDMLWQGGSLILGYNQYRGWIDIALHNKDLPEIGIRIWVSVLLGENFVSIPIEWVATNGSCQTYY